MEEYEISLIGEGIARGYSFNGQGMVTLVDLPVIDGQITNGYGEPYSMSGDVIDLLGWPDSKAIIITDNLAVGVKNSAAASMGRSRSEKKTTTAQENDTKGGRPRGFIGWEYTDGRETTTGYSNEGPGPYHGRLSVAGSAMIFRTKKERDAWVENAPAGVIRESVNKKQLRYLRRGETHEEFDEYMRYLKDELDDNPNEINKLVEEDMRSSY